MPNSGDGTAWAESDPADSNLVSNLPTQDRDLRIGVRIRMSKEHATLDTSSAGGEHKKGSGRGYYAAAASAPTQRPDGATNLDTGDDGRLWVQSDARVMKIWTGTAWVFVKGSSQAVVRGSASPGTAGGTLTAATWNTRTLTTIVNDPDSIVTSLSGNRFTLPAGAYRIRASAPAYKVNTHMIRLQNITDASTVALGTTAYSGVDVEVNDRSFLVTEFTIAGAKAFEIQHNVQTTKATNGGGEKSNIDTETYTLVEIERVG